MMNNILITGSNGFLGRILSNELQNCDLVSLDRNSADLKCDLAKEIPKIKVLPDVVVHCAGKAHCVPKNTDEEKEFYQVNYEGTVNLCNGLVAEDKLPKRFVFISTVSVYGRDIGTQITEESPLEGKTPYALSKIQAEKYLVEWSNKHSVECLILRLPLLIGPNPPGNLGRLISAIRKRRYVKISKNTARKSVLLASDLAKLIISKERFEGIYNLTDGFHPTFGEIEVAIERVFKVNVLSIPKEVIKQLAKVGDYLYFLPFNSETYSKITSELTFDDSKARSELNWQSTNVMEYIYSNESFQNIKTKSTD